MSNPIDASKAVPLDDQEYVRKQRADQIARDEASRNQQTAAAWDRAMNRVFKGIVPRPQRHASLRRIGKQIEAGTHGQVPERKFKQPRSRGGGPYYRSEA